MKERIDELRKKFQVLNFFTDTEIENLLTVIRSVSFGTKRKPQEPLLLRRYVAGQDRKLLTDLEVST